MRIFQFASGFRHEPTVSPSANNGLHVEAVSPAVLQLLTSIAQDFDELANTCLLLLHLEVIFLLMCHLENVYDNCFL